MTIMSKVRVGKQVGDRSVGRNSHEAFDAADPQPDTVGAE